MMNLVKRRNTAEKDKLIRATVRIYWQEIIKRPILFPASVLASMAWTLVQDIFTPLAIAGLTDAIVGSHQDFNRANHMVWLVILFSLLTFLATRLVFAMRNPVLSSTIQRLHMRIFDAYERQEYGFYTNSFVGGLVATDARRCGMQRKENIGKRR